MWPGDFVNLFHLEQGNRLDRRTREATLYIADDGLARVDVDRHAHHGVDDREGIGAGFDAAARVLADVGLVR